MEGFSEVTDIGIDETSKRGHNYIAVFADFARRKIIFRYGRQGIPPQFSDLRQTSRCIAERMKRFASSLATCR